MTIETPLTFKIPHSREERESLRSLAENSPLPNEWASQKVSRTALETFTASLLDKDHEEFLAYLMVLVSNRVWCRQVTAVPYSRRILLLPHCMRNAEKCPAKYDAVGLHCENCGACELARLKQIAETLGYIVMIAEGTPIVAQTIINGRADAILGVGCLRSLERAFEKLQLVGIPAIAVPLNTATCRDSTADTDQIVTMIQTPYCPNHSQEKNVSAPRWIHLLRGAAKLFERQNSVTDSPIDPNIETETVGFDFLSRGGKFYRPFITLASFDALTGSFGTREDGPTHIAAFPNWVNEIAKSIEVFHKASLIHDDIEDEDDFRYGQPTLYKTLGIARAINVGDYLIGCGYRLIARQRGAIESATDTATANAVITEIVTVMSEAHKKLSEVQGAELAWQSRRNRGLTPLDVLTIGALKTAPAFEAALSTGIVLAVAAGKIDWAFYQEIQERIAKFSRHLGVAFQIKNDLDDWRPNERNKQGIGLDVQHGRPTILLALAEIDDESSSGDTQQILKRYSEKNVFHSARRLAAKYSDKAHEIAATIEHDEFRRFLLHLVETVGR